MAAVPSIYIGGLFREYECRLNIFYIFISYFIKKNYIMSDNSFNFFLNRNTCMFRLKEITYIVHILRFKLLL